MRKIRKEDVDLTPLIFALVLLPEKKSRLQFRHCHLTITSAELGESFYPECLEIHNEKSYDFDEMDAEEPGAERYRCENAV